MKKIIFFLLWFPLIFLGCKNTSDCFVEAGDIDTAVYQVPNFKFLKVHGIFQVQLIKSDTPKIEIITNQTLLKNITFETDGDSLYIYDENKCYFLRDYDLKIFVNVYCSDDLLVIQNYNGSNYFTLDTFAITTFYFKNYSYYAKLDLILKTRSSYIEPWNGFGKYHLEGETTFLFVQNTKATEVNALDLKSKIVKVDNSGVSDIYVWAEKNLTVEIKNSGNIYYKGSPQIDSLIEGQGKLIKIQ